MAMNILAAAVLGLLAQGEKDPTLKWKADYSLRLVEKAGKWVFVIEGETNLPPEVKLRARIYALEIIPDFKAGDREDDEPLVWEDDEGQPAFHGFHPGKDGRFHEEVYAFVRKPYSIRYRAKIHYVPRDQSDAVTLKIGDDEFARHADLRLGTDADYEKELKERVHEVARNLVEIEKLYGELSEAYERFAKAYAADDWKAWVEPWYAQVDALNEQNKQRYSLWSVWMERQAKMRVGGMCELMRRIRVAAEEQFKEGAKNEDRIRDMLKGFHNYFEEAIESIGIDAPLDIRRVGPIIAAYEKTLRTLRSEGPSEPALRAVRRDGIGCLFELVPLLQNRKRGYLYVNTVSARFTTLLELAIAKAPAGDLKKALEEHDAALVEFKKFAGLP